MPRVSSPPVLLALLLLISLLATIGGLAHHVPRLLTAYRSSAMPAARR